MSSPKQNELVDYCYPKSLTDDYGTLSHMTNEQEDEYHQMVHDDNKARLAESKSKSKGKGKSKK